jgi:ferredoxin
MTKKRVHSPECIGCWRCISYCRAEGALSMKLTGRKVVLPGIVFALLVLLVFWGGTGIGKMTGNWHTAITPAEYGRLLGK